MCFEETCIVFFIFQVYLDCNSSVQFLVPPLQRSERNYVLLQLSDKNIRQRGIYEAHAISRRDLVWHRLEKQIKVRQLVPSKYILRLAEPVPTLATLCRLERQLLQGEWIFRGRQHYGIYGNGKKLQHVCYFWQKRCNMERPNKTCCNSFRGLLNIQRERKINNGV